jgi:predicted dehydrogenase
MPLRDVEKQVVMRGVIVGFGTIAMGHASAYLRSDSLDIAAVVDPSPDRRAAAEEAFGLRSYPTLADMLRHESPDFLDICAPPHAHLGYTYAGLSRGLHVLCEKPVFPDTADANFHRVVPLIGASTAVLYPAHNYKFAPILDTMRRISGASGFGDILGARFRTLRSGHAVGVPQWRPHWRRDREVSGGGILMDHGPHSIYLAVLLTRSIPRMVSCISGTLDAERHGDTEDTALLRFLGADGVRVDIDLSWAAGHRNSYYAMTGSRGMVTVENDDITYCLDGDLSRSTLRSDFDDPSHREWFRAMLLDFREVVDRPERQWPLVAEAWVTSAVIAAAYRSAAAKGEWVPVDPVPAWLASRLPQDWPAEPAGSTAAPGGPAAHRPHEREERNLPGAPHPRTGAAEPVSWADSRTSDVKNN